MQRIVVGAQDPIRCASLGWTEFSRVGPRFRVSRFCHFHSLSSSAGGNKCCWSGFSLVLSCTDDGCFRGNFGGHLYPLGSLPHLGTVSALVLAGVVPSVLSSVLVVGYSLLVVGCSVLVVGCSPTVVGCSVLGVVVPRLCLFCTYGWLVHSCVKLLGFASNFSHAEASQWSAPGFLISLHIPSPRQ